jgi:NAD+ kinase
MPPFALENTARAARVGVLVSRAEERAPQIAAIGAWARQHDLELVDLGTSAEPRNQDPGCQLVIALGGDGTILRALRLAMRENAAVLGVNFGHVGFLSDIGGDDLVTALDAVAGGRATIDERTALVASFETGQPRRVVAFNDVAVARVPGRGMARLRIEISGEPLLALTGDGVVVASPTGSTAYTIGAGGPAVAPSLDAIVLTPLASQGTPLRSLVVDGSDTVRIEIAPDSAPLRAEIDGRTIEELPMSGSVEVHAAPSKARLVRTRPRTFYSDLAGARPVTRR